MSKSTISAFQLFQAIPDQESARQYLESRIQPDRLTAESLGVTNATIGILGKKTMDKAELENQIQWFRELLEVLELGDVESGILAVEAAIAMLERQRKEKKCPATFLKN